MSSLRLRVLNSFRLLHRARQQVFHEDEISMKASQQRINAEFKKNKHIKDTAKIEELVKTAEDSADFLKKMVVQAIRKDGDDVFATYWVKTNASCMLYGLYVNLLAALRITSDTRLEDNAALPTSGEVTTSGKVGSAAK